MKEIFKQYARFGDILFGLDGIGISLGYRYKKSIFGCVVLIGWWTLAPVSPIALVAVVAQGTAGALIAAATLSIAIA